MCVLPVPGPPAITVRVAVAAIEAAVCWRFSSPSTSGGSWWASADVEIVDSTLCRRPSPHGDGDDALVDPLPLGVQAAAEQDPRPLVEDGLDVN